MVNTDTREKMEKGNSRLTKKKKQKQTNGAYLALLQDPREPKINGLIR